MQREDVINVFKSEFNPILEKFIVIDISVSEASDSIAEHVWKPGVYVFWHPQRGVIRVGRSFDNSRKRALQHLPANTGGVMANLASDFEARLILFNVKKSEDYFWVAALEVYLEKKLKPEIPAGRQG
jgi:hypothetical protein